MNIEMDFCLSILNIDEIKTFHPKFCFCTAPQGRIDCVGRQLQFIYGESEVRRRRF